MFKNYFSLEQRILLNSKIFSFKNFEKKCLELKEKNLVSLIEYSSLNDFKKAKNEEKDYIKLCSNYSVSVINTHDISFDNSVDLFKSLVFYMFPAYACVDIINENLLSYYSFEEMYIAKTLQDLNSIKQFKLLNEIEFTSLLIFSLYINPEKDIEYKRFIKRWFVSNELPLPRFTLNKDYYYDRLSLLRFFYEWVSFFMKNNRKFKQVPKILTNALFAKKEKLGLNKQGDHIAENIKFRETNHILELFNYYVLLDDSYYFFYKTNSNIFDIYAYTKSVNTKTLNINSDVFQISKHSERVNIFSNKQKATLRIGSNEFIFNKENNFQYDLLINDNENNIIKQFELFHVSFNKTIAHSANLDKCTQSYPSFSRTNLIKGLQLYNLAYKKVFSLLVTNENFPYTYIFLDEINRNEIKKVSFENFSNAVIYYFKRPFTFNFDFLKVEINKNEKIFNILVKNMICDDSEIEKKIEKFWILKKLGDIHLDCHEIDHFDILYQSKNESIPYDSNLTVSDILATNLKINIKNVNEINFKFDNIFYLSILTCLNLNIKNLHIATISESSHESFFYLEGEFNLFNNDSNYDYNCHIFLSSINKKDIKHIQTLKEIKNLKLKLNIAKYEKNSITIATKKYAVSEIDQRLFILFEIFVEKQFIAMLGLFVPLLRHI